MIPTIDDLTLAEAIQFMPYQAPDIVHRYVAQWNGMTGDDGTYVLPNRNLVLGGRTFTVQPDMEGGIVIMVLRKDMKEHALIGPIKQLDALAIWQRIYPFLMGLRVSEVESDPAQPEV